MKTILQFLKDKEIQNVESSEMLRTSDKGMENLRDLFKTQFSLADKSKYLRIHPQIQREQIWSVKTDYDDFQGISQEILNPMLVWIGSVAGQIEAEDYIRVCPVSPFTELSAEDDEICEDSSLIGFPFLVELWNEQPMLTELLDRYLGYYQIKTENRTKNEVLKSVGEPKAEYTKGIIALTPEQEEFRLIEISRAKYLNHSVLSLLSFLENRQEQNAGVVISWNDKIEYPQFFTEQHNEKHTLLLAAKTAIDKNDEYWLADNPELPFKIFIRKDKNGFIITVMTSEKVRLVDQKNTELNCELDTQRSVFSNIDSGIYRLFYQGLNSPLKIRLK
ncbi:MAG: hypothetical protein K9I71_07230 [Ignavibacteriales bacterium]|nr:hypothetical protein [Melioribacteraceae bacterium]MCF8306046.1 hypothetical protein [Ignavibacteriales bacterium]MCF8315899.1 hypothetical protein [Ignavibacteriales bacterium]MCF8437359.1 hypothetical protein [Ignavibacteriales bacterium]